MAGADGRASGSGVWDRTGHKGGMAWILYVGAWSAGREDVRRRAGGGCTVLLEILYITRTCGFGCNERAKVELSEASIPHIHSSNIRFFKPPTAVPHAGWSRLMQQHVVATWTRDDWCPGGEGVPRGKGMGPHMELPLAHNASFTCQSHAHTHWRGLGARYVPFPFSFRTFPCEVIQPRLRLPRSYFVVFRLTLRQLVLALRRDHPSRPSARPMMHCVGRQVLVGLALDGGR